VRNISAIHIRDGGAIWALYAESPTVCPAPYSQAYIRNDDNYNIGLYNASTYTFTDTLISTHDMCIVYNVKSFPRCKAHRSQFPHPCS